LSGWERSLAVVVLGWNHREDSAECLRSILATSYPALCVWFVDNGSTDGTPEFLARQFPEVTLLELGENRGLVAGYNVGIEAALVADYDYICVLNNDVVVVPNTFHALMTASRVNCRAGIWSPKIVYYDEDNLIWSAGAYQRRFPPGVVQRGMGASVRDRFTRLEPITYATSCAWLMSAQMVREIGAFSPKYSFYYSDYEYCARARAHGWQILFVPDAIIKHKVSLSTQRAPRPAVWWYNLGNAEAEFYRELKAITVLPLHAAWIVARSVLQGHIRFVPAYLNGLISGLRRR